MDHDHVVALRGRFNSGGRLHLVLEVSLREEGGLGARRPGLRPLFHSPSTHPYPPARRPLPPGRPGVLPRWPLPRLHTQAAVAADLRAGLPALAPRRPPRRQARKRVGQRDRPRQTVRLWVCARVARGWECERARGRGGCCHHPALRLCCDSLVSRPRAPGRRPSLRPPRRRVGAGLHGGRGGHGAAAVPGRLRRRPARARRALCRGAHPRPQSGRLCESAPECVGWGAWRGCRGGGGCDEGRGRPVGRPGSPLRGARPAPRVLHDRLPAPRPRQTRVRGRVVDSPVFYGGCGDFFPGLARGARVVGGRARAPARPSDRPRRRGGRPR